MGAAVPVVSQASARTSSDAPKRCPAACFVGNYHRRQSASIFARRFTRAPARDRSRHFASAPRRCSTRDIAGWGEERCGRPGGNRYCCSSCPDCSCCGRTGGRCLDYCSTTRPAPHGLLLTCPRVQGQTARYAEVNDPCGGRSPDRAPGWSPPVRDSRQPPNNLPTSVTNSATCWYWRGVMIPRSRHNRK